MKILIVLIIIIALFLLTTYLVLKLNPAFGGRITGKRKIAVQQSRQYSQGKFVNPQKADMMSGTGVSLSLMIEFAKRDPLRRPLAPIPVDPWTPLPESEIKKTAITWFGHSALMIETNGQRILLDPMLGRTPSPFSFAGGTRYGELPISAAELPAIDIVIFSHDHYDHLDYGTIMQIKDKTRLFVVPLGLGTHLERWGVDPKRIEEHDWWDEFQVEDFRFACTPAQHLTGRGLNDKNATLWCSWVIETPQHRIFFSGDGGYNGHFAEIGRKYGPFDVALMECGQYDRRWADIHCTPEQTVKAFQDVQGGLLIPIHWAAFTLAFHSWTDPIERVTRASQEQGVAITTPRIGEKVILGESPYPASAWWRI